MSNGYSVDVIDEPAPEAPPIVSEFDGTIYFIYSQTRIHYFDKGSRSYPLLSLCLWLGK